MLSRIEVSQLGLPPYVENIESRLSKALEITLREDRLPILQTILVDLHEQQNPQRLAHHDHLLLAEIYWELNRSEESIASLKEAITSAPKDARAFGLLGRYLLYKGLPAQALNFLDRAIELNPQDTGFRKLRMRAQRQKDKAYAILGQQRRVVIHDDRTQNRAMKREREVTQMLDLGKVNEALGAWSPNTQTGTNGSANLNTQALSPLVALSGAQKLKIALSESGSTFAERNSRNFTRFFVTLLCMSAALVIGALAREQVDPVAALKSQTSLEEIDPSLSHLNGKIALLNQEPEAIAFECLRHVLYKTPFESSSLKNKSNPLSACPTPIIKLAQTLEGNENRRAQATPKLNADLPPDATTETQSLPFTMDALKIKVKEIAVQARGDVIPEAQTTTVMGQDTFSELDVRLQTLFALSKNPSKSLLNPKDLATRIANKTLNPYALYDYAAMSMLVENRVQATEDRSQIKSVLQAFNTNDIANHDDAILDTLTSLLYHGEHNHVLDFMNAHPELHEENLKGAKLYARVSTLLTDAEAKKALARTGSEGQNTRVKNHIVVSFRPHARGSLFTTEFAATLAGEDFMRDIEAQTSSPFLLVERAKEAYPLIKLLEETNSETLEQSIANFAELSDDTVASPLGRLVAAKIALLEEDRDSAIEELEIAIEEVGEKEWRTYNVLLEELQGLGKGNHLKKRGPPNLQVKASGHAIEDAQKVED